MLNFIKNKKPEQFIKYKAEIEVYMKKRQKRLGILDISNLIHKYFYIMHTSNNELLKNYKEFLDVTGINYGKLEINEMDDILRVIFEDNYDEIKEKIYMKTYNCSYEDHILNIVDEIITHIDILITYHYLSHFIIAWDTSNITKLRRIIFPNYKQNRSVRPQSFIDVKEKLLNRLKEFNYPIIESNEYEADDVIYSVVEKHKEKFNKITIITLDKDLYCLVEPFKVQILDTSKTIDGYVRTEEDVINKLGVKPNQVELLLTIKGDSVDGIKGVRGIGDVGAKTIINEYENYNSLMKDIRHYVRNENTNLSDRLGLSLTKKLVNDLDNLLLSYKLVNLELMDLSEFDINYFKTIKDN